MLCSRSIGVHLARGMAGLALLAMAGSMLDSHIALSASAAVAAMLLLRGCPMCWLAGLFRTVLRHHASQAGRGQSRPEEPVHRVPVRTAHACSRTVPARLNEIGA